MANVIVASAAAAASGVDVVTGQDVDAGRAALALAERAQVRPALGDPAVVVAVDEIGGLE